MTISKPTRCPYCHTPAVVTYRVKPVLPNDSSLFSHSFTVVGKFPVCSGPCQEMMAQRELEARRGLTTFE